MKIVLGILLLLGSSISCFAAEDAQNLDKRLDAARTTIDQIMSTPDALPNPMKQQRKSSRNPISARKRSIRRDG